MDTINISNLHQCFDRVNPIRKYRKGNDFHPLFIFFNYYIQFFIQLASPLRRFAELTYLFIYEYSPKIETLLRMENRANFVIIKEINEVKYLQLVFDCYKHENILSVLPIQFLKPKLAVIICREYEKVILTHPEFNPEFLLVISDQLLPVGKNMSTYFLKYRDYLSNSGDMDDQLMINKIVC